MIKKTAIFVAQMKPSVADGAKSDQDVAKLVAAVE